MQKSPTLDKDLNIVHDGYSEKFREVRNKAHEDEVERRRKSKKDKTIKVPKFSVGQQVVCVESRMERNYFLIETVDFIDEGKSGFSYFGIVLKVSNEKHKDRVGHLISFQGSDNVYWRIFEVPVEVDSIKWLEDNNEKP